MRVLKLDRNMFLGLSILMLIGPNKLDINIKYKILIELLTFLEPEGLVVRSETRKHMRNKFKMSSDYYKKTLQRLQIEGHIQLRGDIIYPHPKYIAIARSEGSLLITTK